MGLLSNEERLKGHKRPWWQWNVLTLFGALFVMIWARELIAPDAWRPWIMLTSLIVVVWVIAPLVVMTPNEEKDEVILVPVGETPPAAQPQLSDAWVVGVSLAMVLVLFLLKLLEKALTFPW